MDILNEPFINSIHFSIMDGKLFLVVIEYLCIVFSLFFIFIVNFASLGCYNFLTWSNAKVVDICLTLK